MEVVKYVRGADIVTADMNGETVLMDIATGKYYNLGECGTVCEGHQTFPDEDG